MKISLPPAKYSMSSDGSLSFPDWKAEQALSSLAKRPAFEKKISYG